MIASSGVSGWIGTVPGWLTLIGLAAAGWIFLRGGGGTAITSLEAANRILEREVEKLREADRKKDKEISELRGRTDVALAVAPIITWTEHHEGRAQERHDRSELRADERQTAMLNLLELIASRLGPEATQ